MKTLFTLALVALLPLAALGQGVAVRSLNGAATNLNIRGGTTSNSLVTAITIVSQTNTVDRINSTGSQIEMEAAGSTLILGSGALTLSGAGSGFIGIGANLTGLNASQLTSGTVPDARFPAILPALDGSGLTNLNIAAQVLDLLTNAGTFKWVAVTGSDSGDGSSNAPFASLNAAVTALNGKGIVIIREGVYTNLSLNCTNAYDIALIGMNGAVTNNLGQQVSDFTVQSNGIYSATVATNIYQQGAGHPFIYEWGTPQFPIPYANRHPLYAGRTHYGEHTQLTNTPTYAALTNNAGWFLIGTTLFVKFSDGAAPGGRVVYLPRSDTNASTIYGGLGNNQVTVSGIKTYFGYNGYNVWRLGHFIISDCVAFGNFEGGLYGEAIAGSGKSLRCEFAGNNNDGSAYDQIGATFQEEDLWVHDNWSQGSSAHYGANSIITGGLYERNQNGGVTPFGGSAVQVFHATVRDNTVGFYVAGTPADTNRQTVVSGYQCILTGNTFGAAANNTESGVGVNLFQCFLDSDTLQTAFYTNHSEGDAAQFVNLTDCTIGTAAAGLSAGANGLWPTIVNGQIPDSLIVQSNVTALAFLGGGAGLTNGNPTNFFGAGTIPIAKLARGTPDGTKFINDAGDLAVPAGGAGSGLTNHQTGTVFFDGGQLIQTNGAGASNTMSSEGWIAMSGPITNGGGLTILGKSPVVLGGVVLTNTVQGGVESLELRLTASPANRGNLTANILAGNSYIFHDAGAAPTTLGRMQWDTTYNAMKPVLLNGVTIGNFLSRTTAQDYAFITNTIFVKNTNNAGFTSIRAYTNGGTATLLIDGIPLVGGSGGGGTNTFYTDTDPDWRIVLGGANSYFRIFDSNGAQTGELTENGNFTIPGNMVVAGGSLTITNQAEPGTDYEMAVFDDTGTIIRDPGTGVTIATLRVTDGFITNLFAGAFYPTNVYVTSWQAITNAWAGATNTYTLTTYDQFYTTLTPVHITNVAGYDLTNHVFSTLEITNASGSNIIVYTPASVRFDDALTAHTVYAGGKGKFYFDAGPGGTNCVVVSFGAPEVGEYVTNVLTAANALALTTATAANITNISLTAGDWDITGVVGFDAGATTTSTYMQGGISTVSATLGALGTYFSNPFAVATTAEDAIEVCPTVRLSLTTTTTVYLVGRAGFAISTMGGFGHIRATRIK